ncbi:MAG: hypothetical protein AAFY11_03510 [Cyanobacteria bacterium J06641_5]
MSSASDPAAEGGAVPKKKEKLSAPDYPPAPSGDQVMPVLRDGTSLQGKRSK